MAALGESALNALATLQGTRLFGRQLNLTLGVPNSPTLLASAAFNDKNSHGVDVSGLDCDFVVEKSLKPIEPNTLALKVHNFSEDTRQSLSGQHAITVRLEAGYVGAVSQLYFAEARAAWTDAGGDGAATYTTHIESTDTIARPTGVRATKKIQAGAKGGNIYRTMGPKVPLHDAFRALAGVLGVGVGNLEAAVTKYGTGIQSVNGSALLGNAAQRMTDICRSAGLEWSIQDGQLQLLNVGGVLSTTQAILISANTGMLDSPSVDSQGVVSVKTRLIPGLAPGVLVVIDSLFVGSGSGFRVQKCRYTGSTYGEAWDCEFTAVPYT